MNNLADVLKRLNKLREAEALYRDALNFRKANLKPNHPDIRNSLNNVAIVLQSQNRLKEAEELFRELLDLQNEHLLPNHPDIGATKKYLASLLEILGGFEEEADKL
jgi:tetratricopeptide (TPR) repeat protein